MNCFIQLHFYLYLVIVSNNFYSLVRLMSWGLMMEVIEVMFEVMRYFGLNRMQLYAICIRLYGVERTIVQNV